ncbi:MAG: hypothetical protein ABIY62_07570 [Ginsengibacter sp.]
MQSILNDIIALIKYGSFNKEKNTSGAHLLSAFPDINIMIVGLFDRSTVTANKSKI